MKQFDYEEKIWGLAPVKLSPFYIQGLKLQYTLEDLLDRKGKILDIGCGAGNMAKGIKYYRPDLEIYGIDISEKAIQIAKHRSQGIQFILGKGEQLPYKDNFFDAIVMYDVLEHIEKPEKILQEVQRVLKENGIVHIFSPLDGQPWSFYTLVPRLAAIKNAQTGHVQMFSDKNFKKLLTANGFIVLKKRYSFHVLIAFLDILYYSFLAVFHIRPSSSLEGYMYKQRQHVITQIFRFLYRILIAAGSFESRLLVKVPGSGGTYTVRKRVA